MTLIPPPPRAERFTAGQVAQALHETKGLVTLAAKRLNCSPQTIRNYMERYPTVAQAIKDEREALVDLGELALYKQVQNGEAWAVTLLLKTLGKDRGYVERSEHTGKDGGAVEHDVNVRGVIEVQAVDYRSGLAALSPLEPLSLAPPLDEAAG